MAPLWRSRTGGGQIGRSVWELTRLDARWVSCERRSLSFNHNSGPQPGPSNSCWLRPSSCGIPLSLLALHFSYYLPAHLVILIWSSISTRIFFFYLHRYICTKVVFVGQQALLCWTITHSVKFLFKF